MLKISVLSRKYPVNIFLEAKRTIKKKVIIMQTETKTSPNRIAILWFRNDLRLTDNSILNEAIDLISKKKIDKVVPFYCFDENTFEGKSRLLKIPRCGTLRRNFLIESVENLKQNLTLRLNSNLMTSYGQPVNEILKLVQVIETDNNNKVDLVVASREIPSEEVDLEVKLKKELDSRKTHLKLIWDQTMIHLDDLPFKKIDQMPDMFTQLRKMVEIRGKESNYNVRNYFIIPNGYSLSTLGEPVDYAKAVTQIPVKEQMSASTPSKNSAIENMKGGEDEALKRVDDYFFRSDGLKFYKNTRNGLLGTEYSSKLSMWLALGCLSARYLYHKVKQYERDEQPNESTVHFVFELLWRDFFKFNGFKYGNRIFFLNGFRSLNNRASSAGASSYSDSIKWKSCDNKWDKELFDKWCSGDTGYPLVDANMKELNETGWMSNRGRQNIASFLAKDLEIDWRYGAEYFENKLIDYDCTSNWGNWQYGAGVGADPRADRYFNVIKQAYDYDENGAYVKHWLPKLTNVSLDYVHCPFRMGLADMKRFGCVIGTDYPAPIVKMKNEWKPSQRNKVNKFAAKSKYSK